MASGSKVEVIIGAVDKVAAPIRRINRQFDAMLAPIRRVNRSLKSLSREVGLNKLARGIGKMGRALSRVAVAGGAAAGVMGIALQRLASRGDDVAKLTRRLNFASDSFQEWAFAADRQGVSSSTFRRSVEALSKRVGELKAGTGALSTLLGKTDPEFAKLLASSTDTSEAFELVIKRLSEREDPMERAAFAAAAFSRSGLAMIQLAQAGAEGIEALRDRARELGLVMSSDTLAASEKMKDSLTDLKSIGWGLWQQIGGQLMPVVSKITDEITAWAVANQEWITTNISGALKAVIEQGRAFANWVRAVSPKVEAFVESIGGLATVAKIVGVALGVTLVAPVIAFVAAVGAIPLAISAAVASIIVFWDEVRAGFDSLMAWMRDVSIMLDPLREAIGLDARHVNPVAAGGGGLSAEEVASVRNRFSSGGGPLLGGSAELVVRTEPGVRAAITDSSLHGVDIAADDTGVFLLD